LPIFTWMWMNEFCQCSIVFSGFKSLSIAHTHQDSPPPRAPSTSQQICELIAGAGTVGEMPATDIKQALPGDPKRLFFPNICNASHPARRPAVGCARPARTESGGRGSRARTAACARSAAAPSPPPSASPALPTSRCERRVEGCRRFGETGAEWSAVSGLSHKPTEVEVV
jgi:hypothetical protein